MSKHQDFQIFGLNLNKHQYFYQLEVMDRGSETQLEVGAN